VFRRRGKEGIRDTWRRAKGRKGRGGEDGTVRLCEREKVERLRKAAGDRGKR